MQIRWKTEKKFRQLEKLKFYKTKKFFLTRMQRLEKIFEPRLEVKVLIKKFLIFVTDVVVTVVVVVVVVVVTVGVVVVGVTVARMPTLWMT